MNTSLKKILETRGYRIERNLDRMSSVITHPLVDEKLELTDHFINLRLPEEVIDMLDRWLRKNAKSASEEYMKDLREAESMRKSEYEYYRKRGLPTYEPKYPAGYIPPTTLGSGTVTYDPTVTESQVKELIEKERRHLKEALQKVVDIYKNEIEDLVNENKELRSKLADQRGSARDEVPF